MRKLNFGSGRDIREGFDNVDLQEGEGVMKSFDFNKFPYPIVDDTYDYILSIEVFEHLDKLDEVLYELWRITKHDGIIEIHVPHYTNKGAYDLYHTHYLDDLSFVRFVNQVNIINRYKKFEIVDLELEPTKVGKFIFKSLREKLALFLNGLIEGVNVKLKVIKVEG